MNSHTSYYNYVTTPVRKRMQNAAYIVLAVVVLTLSAYILSYNLNQVMLKGLGQKSRYESVALYNSPVANPQPMPSVQGISTSYRPEMSTLKMVDYRAYVLDEYFRYHGSPLYGTGEIFVRSCDRYGAPADCTTVAAIAHAETNLCKYSNSADYYNCWGFGGGGEHRIYFNSWRESIDLVTDRLVNAYGIKYMIDPSLMETTFCGDEPGCTNWGLRVKYFIRAISEFPKQRGIGQSLLSFR